MSKPKIGITIDANDPNIDESAKKYSTYYWYAQRSAPIETIIKTGGIPILLPHNIDQIDDYIPMLDGLLITGGGHDTPPEYFDEEQHEKSRIKIRRSSFEKEITLKMISLQKPILGICGGMQLLAALYGGKLFQYLPEDGNFNEHTQRNAPDEPCHTVSIKENTKLYEVLGSPKEAICVNSVHQQGVKHPGKLKPSAYAEDGLIEAFEDPTHPFCLGVQWHPEYLVTNYDKILFESFIKQCQNKK